MKIVICDWCNTEIPNQAGKIVEFKTEAKTNDGEKRWDGWIYADLHIDCLKRLVEHIEEALKE